MTRMPEIELIPVIESNSQAFIALDHEVLSLTRGDENLVSFSLPELTLLAPNHSYHLATSCEIIVGRCGINLAPDEADIAGYGDFAHALYHQGPSASLVGDLVHPNFRGNRIQQAMIAKRMEMLPEMGYVRAWAGIICTNKASKRSYLRSGFERIGTKKIAFTDGDVRLVELFSKSIH